MARHKYVCRECEKKGFSPCYLEYEGDIEPPTPVECPFGLGRVKWEEVK